MGMRDMERSLEQWEMDVRDVCRRLARARQTGSKIFFADEAHFRAEAELRGKWVLKGEPARLKHFCRSGVNQFCRFTSCSLPLCCAASVRTSDSWAPWDR